MGGPFSCVLERLHQAGIAKKKECVWIWRKNWLNTPPPDVS